VAKREFDERKDGQPAVEVGTPSHQIADAGGARAAASERRALRSLVLSIGDPRTVQARRPPRAPAAVPLADDRRRLERDLHDGVQNELVALIVKRPLAQRDPETPPALVEMLAGLEARAQAALDSVRKHRSRDLPSAARRLRRRRSVARAVGVAAVDVRLMGSAPRGTEAAEEAVYFACSEAIQNATKYAGRGTQVTPRLRHPQGSLAVRIAHDGRGFDRAHTPEGAGVRNIRDRVEDLGGRLEVASSPGHGTVLTISLPWPAAADRRR
jgi:signal transduction histidine kinase